MINIYVGNLNFRTDEQQVRELFSQFGTVDRVSLITDRETGRSKGFGFVEMSNDAEGKAAIAALDGKEHDGRPLRVNEAKPREERGSGGGGFRGGGGGGGGGHRGSFSGGDRREQRW